MPAAKRTELFKTEKTPGPQSYSVPTDKLNKGVRIGTYKPVVKINLTPGPADYNNQKKLRSSSASFTTQKRREIWQIN